MAPAFAVRSPLQTPIRSAISNPLEVRGSTSGTPPTYTPSLDFSDPRNSQYAAGQFAIGVGVN